MFFRFLADRFEVVLSRQQDILVKQFFQAGIKGFKILDLLAGQ